MYDRVSSNLKQINENFFIFMEICEDLQQGVWLHDGNVYFIKIKVTMIQFYLEVEKMFLGFNYNTHV